MDQRFKELDMINAFLKIILFSLILLTLLEFSAYTGIQRQEEDFGLTQTDRRTQSQGLINCRLSFLEGRFLRQVVCLNNGSLSGYIFPLLNGVQLLQLQV